MKKSKLSALMALSLSLSVLGSSGFGVHAESRDSIAPSIETIVKDTASNCYRIFQADLFTHQGDLQPVGPVAKLDEEQMNKLMETVKPGQMTAVKQGSFVSETDGEKGIVQLTFDIAGKPENSSEEMNILFILDSSGSMNMYYITDGFGSSLTSCCLDEDHYYYIPAGVFNNAEGGYVKISDFNPECPVWNSMFVKEGEQSIPARWAVDMLNSFTKPIAKENRTDETPAENQDEQQTEEEPSANDEQIPVQAADPALQPLEPAVDPVPPAVEIPAAPVIIEQPAAPAMPENPDDVTPAADPAALPADPVPATIQDDSALRAPVEDPAIQEIPAEPVTDNVLIPAEAADPIPSEFPAPVPAETPAEIPAEIPVEQPAPAPVQTPVETVQDLPVQTDQTPSSDPSDGLVPVSDETEDQPLQEDDGTNQDNILDPDEPLFLDETEVNDVVKGSDYYQPVYDSGYVIDSQAILKWQPEQNHYAFVDGQYVHIDKPVLSEEQKTQMSEQGYAYYSPDSGSNPYGCKDRAMVSRQVLSDFIKAARQSDPNTDFALETFAGSAKVLEQIPFTSDPSALLQTLKTSYGADYTNYQLAFDSAATLWDGADQKNRKNYTLFISDGRPSTYTTKMSEQIDPEKYALYNGNQSFYAGDLAAQAYKKAVNGTLYTFGLQTDVAPYLSLLATSPQNSLNFSTMEQFSDYLSDLHAALFSLYPKDAVLQDVISDDFDFIIDPGHPFAVNDERYKALSELPSNVIVDGKTIRVSLPKTIEPSRVSFYIRALPSVLANSTYDGLYATNASANLSYTPAVLEDGKLAYGKPVSVDIETPYARFRNSIVTLHKSSDKENKDVRPGETITYTIQVSNRGMCDVRYLLLEDRLDDQLIFKDDPNLRVVSFDVNDLLHNSSQDFSFAVIVKEGASGKVENSAALSKGPDDPDPLPSNKLVNPIPPEPAKPVLPGSPVIPPAVIRPVTGLMENPAIYALAAAAALGAIVIVRTRKKY